MKWKVSAIYWFGYGFLVWLDWVSLPFLGVRERSVGGNEYFRMYLGSLGRRKRIEKTAESCEN